MKSQNSRGVHHPIQRCPPPQLQKNLSDIRATPMVQDVPTLSRVMHVKPKYQANPLAAVTPLTAERKIGQNPNPSHTRKIPPKKYTYKLHPFKLATPFQPHLQVTPTRKSLKLAPGSMNPKDVCSVKEREKKEKLCCNNSITIKRKPPKKFFL